MGHIPSKAPFCVGIFLHKLFVRFGEPSPHDFALGPECGLWDFHLTSGQGLDLVADIGFWLDTRTALFS